MLSTATAAALVGAAQPRPQPSISVEVLRPFMHAGARVEVGAVVEVSPAVARELEAAGKATRNLRQAAEKPRGRAKAEGDAK